MKLTDLEPKFIRYESRVITWTRVLGDPLTWKSGDPTEQVTGPREHKIFVDSLAEAQGIWFRCPKCRSHCVEATFAGRGVPDDMGTHNKAGEAVRWNVSGTGFEDLTTTPSILLQGGCDWHGFVTNGDVT